MLSRLVVVTAALLCLGIGIAGTSPASAEKKENYAACKKRLSQQPPCNSNWTRACAAQCGSKF